MLRYNSFSTHRALLLLMFLIAGGNAIWAQTFTPAYNIATVNTTYKTAIFNTGNRKVTIHLFENAGEVAGDCEALASYMQNHCYARWYLEDGDGNLIPDATLTSEAPYTPASDPQYGWYRHSFKYDPNHNIFDKLVHDTNIRSYYNPTITLSLDYLRYDAWRNVKVVCVVTSKDGGFNDWGTAEPELQWKYVYTLRTEDDLKIAKGNLPFAHYRGEAYEYATQMLQDASITLSDSQREALTATLNNYDYTTVSGTGAPQFKWENGDYVSAEGVRQSVASYDYYYYMDLQPGETDSLYLPFAHYSNVQPRQDPQVFVRWYDYQTDKASPYIVKKNNGVADYLTEWTYNGESYGLVGPIRDGKFSRCLPATYENRNRPEGGTWYRGEVGVLFKAPEGFQGLDGKSGNRCSPRCIPLYGRPGRHRTVLRP